MDENVVGSFLFVPRRKSGFVCIVTELDWIMVSSHPKFVCKIHVNYICAIHISHA